MAANFDIKGFIEQIRRKERQKVLLEIQTLLTKKENTTIVVKAVCGNCKHYIQHYARDGWPGHWTYEKIHCGHCVDASRIKKRTPNNVPCQSWKYAGE